MTYTNEKLSAFLDGELPDSEMQAIEKAIHSDSALAERLEDLANIDRQLRQTFEPVLNEPIPGAVLSLLDETEEQTPSNLISFAAQKKFRKTWQLPAAIAASLMVGFFVSEVYNQAGSGNGEFTATGPVPETSQLFAALSSLVSGQKLGDIEPVLSFISTAGEYCREFTATFSRGLACRNGRGWHVVSQIYTAKANSEDGYSTASAQSFEAFDALVDNLITGETLSQLHEERLIKSKWAFDGK